MAFKPCQKLTIINTSFFHFSRSLFSHFSSWQSFSFAFSVSLSPFFSVSYDPPSIYLTLAHFLSDERYISALLTRHAPSSPLPLSPEKLRPCLFGRLLSRSHNGHISLNHLKCLAWVHEIYQRLIPKWFIWLNMNMLSRAIDYYFISNETEFILDYS